VIDETLLDAMDKMAKAFDHVQAQFSSVRTGRANASFVDKIMVDYYGAMVPMQQLATFQVPEARQLVIKPHDRGAIPAIEKAIQAADLGVNPSNDGVSIRLTFPPLTGERRKELVKVVKNMAEEGRISLRNHRRSTRQELEALEKAGDLSKDELERAEKELDKIIHAHEAEIGEALGAKETELMED